MAAMWFWLGLFWLMNAWRGREHHHLTSQFSVKNRIFFFCGELQNWKKERELVVSLDLAPFPENLTRLFWCRERKWKRWNAVFNLDWILQPTSTVAEWRPTIVMGKKRWTSAMEGEQKTGCNLIQEHLQIQPHLTGVCKYFNSCFWGKRIDDFVNNLWRKDLNLDWGLWWTFLADDTNALGPIFH